MAVQLPTSRPALRKHVYEYIRSQINYMQLEPGTRLAISKLANQLNAHYSQVREAILMLVEEGLLEVREGHYHVIRFDLHFLNTIFTLRRALQIEALQQCAKYAERKDLEWLRQMWQEFRVHGLQPDRTETFFENDLYFHQRIGELSTNRYLKQCLDRLLSVDLLIQRWSHHTGAFPLNHVEYSVEAYLKVLNELLSNNTQAAVDTLDGQLKRTHEGIGALAERQRSQVR